MSEKLIQSHVWREDKCFFVSTINRVSSAALACGAIYAETMVWEFNPETGHRRDFVGQGEGLRDDISHHIAICRKLRDTGRMDD